MSKNMTTEPTMKPKKIHMVSLGCPKNLVDSEMMLGALKTNGYEVSDDPEAADTIIVNTCSFLDDSKRESVEKILEVADLKKNGDLEKLVVTGCLVQRYKDDLLKDLPEVDHFVGSGSFPEIVNIIESSNPKKDHYHLPTFLQKDDTPRVNSEPFYRAFLKISEGCMKRCSFCAIPKIRGNLQSRTVQSIVNEAKLLVAGGVREVNIISHDFTDYGWDLRRKNPEAKESPYNLLDALSKVEGLDWIRLLYLYPDGLSPEIIQLISERDNLVPYFDMPLQHINNHVLGEMNRKMTREIIEETLGNIRKLVPSAVFRTQFIVGFPGESEEAFEELLSFIEDQRFDRVGCFKYSPQEGTTGFRKENQIAEEIKEERYHRLMIRQNEISREIHKSFIGKTVSVIVDGFSEESELLLQGRMATQAPGVDGVVLINDGVAKPGEIVQVEITDSHDYDLVGKVLATEY